ncbi:hypothetical protein EDB81DRAFT_751697 [Dactylonectria macrodidyma]|uniref:BZIP domain-containing protein n=1 Tax=Dactylonectria macrodidyma TaxID=307937 RepID=A0A9P9JIW6_9HYPO|nr:hypothetical protein EDB81DRAFT_751697 [Dactylonectria macrodidyma]
MAGYSKPRNTEKPVSNNPHLQRVREVQRKARAKKREYLQDLERRVQVYELEGIKISYKLQQEAQRIARDNVRLRELARTLGISEEEIVAALDAAGYDETDLPPAPEPVQPLYGPSQAYLDLMAAMEPRPVTIPSWPLDQTSVPAPSPSPELQPECLEEGDLYGGASLIDGDYTHSGIPPRLPFTSEVYGQPAPSFSMAPMGLNPYLTSETLLPPVQAAQAYYPQQQQQVDFQMVPMGQPQESPDRPTWDMSLLHQLPPYL